MEEKALNKKALKAAIMYIFNNFLVKAISILTVPIFSRILSTTEYGIVSNFQSWLSILTIIFSLDLHTSIQRAKLDYEKSLDKYISSILSLSSIVIIIIAVFSNLFSGFVQDILKLDSFMLNYIYLYIFFNCAFNFYQIKCRVQLRYKVVTLISITTSLLSVAVSLLLITFMKDLAMARIIGITLPTLIVSIFLYIKTFKLGKTFINLEYWKYALKYSLPLIPHSLANNMLSQFDRVMITNIKGYDSTALYAMAYNVAALLSLVNTSFGNAWTPWFFEKMKLERYDEIKKISKYYFLVFWMISIVLLAGAPEILRIFADQKYYSAVSVIPPVVIGLVFQFVNGFCINIESYYKKNKFIPIGTVLSCIINIILNAIFIPIYGYTAAAYTTLISYILLLLFHYIIAKRLTDINKLYDIKYFAYMLLITFFIGIYFIIIYNNLLLRCISLIAIFAIILVKNKEQIKKLKKFRKI